MKNDYVVFDLETTGLNVTQDQIVEIAGVRVRQDRVVDKFQTLVLNTIPIPPEATRIHGITEEMTARNGVDAHDALRRFSAFAEGLALIAHNGIGFDFLMLANHLKKHQVDHADNRLLDSLPLSKAYLGSVTGNSNLAALCTQFGISNTQAHRALSDALATQKLISLAIEESGLSIAELWQKHSELSLKKLWEVPEGMELLQQAIDLEIDLCMEYQSDGKPPGVRWVRPRSLILSRGGRVCISAFCHRSRTEKQFRLDRILRLIAVGEWVSDAG